MAPINFLSSPTVTLLIGHKEDPTPFSVHQSLLIERFKSIANALQQDRWLEGAERVISFIEEDPRIFAEYLHYVYRPNLIEVSAAAVTAGTFEDDYTSSLA
jgi:hypothetical protein